MFSPIRQKRRFPALIAAAFFSSFLIGPAAFADAAGGNTVKFMSQQGMQYHVNSRREAQRRQAAQAEARQQQHGQRQPHGHTSTAAAQSLGQ